MLFLQSFFFQYWSRATSCVESDCDNDISSSFQQRFNEWGRAVLDLQLAQLNQNSGHEYFFTAYYSEREAGECDSLSSDIGGVLLSVLTSFFPYLPKDKPGQLQGGLQLHCVRLKTTPSFMDSHSEDWWDGCAEAGVKTRPQELFSKPLPSLALLALQNGKLVLLVCHHA